MHTRVPAAPPCCHPRAARQTSKVAELEAQLDECERAKAKAATVEDFERAAALHESLVSLSTELKAAKTVQIISEQADSSARVKAAPPASGKERARGESSAAPRPSVGELQRQVDQLERAKAAALADEQYARAAQLKESLQRAKAELQASVAGLEDQVASRGSHSACIAFS